MRWADPVNDEFEVGFNRTFERSWRRPELVGRVVMIVLVAAALLGRPGHGPFSHARKTSPSSGLSVDYEPIARHGTATTVTVHLNRPGDTNRPMQPLLDKHMVDPVGFQHATPMADHTSLSDAGMWLTFRERAGQHNALVRLDLPPTALGMIPMQVTDGTDTVKWSMLVVP